MRAPWHLITPEYPPQIGGVSDYTHLLAEGLTRLGEDVHVWCPAAAASAAPDQVSVHRDLGKISPADLRRVGRKLNKFPHPRRILVQWVPHGYGWRSLNLPLCLWLLNRSLRCGDKIEIIVHEPFLAFGEGSWKQQIAALAHRVMAIVLLGATRRVWVSIPEWEKRWKPFALGRDVKFRWLPIPSNIPVSQNADRIEAVRRLHASAGELLIGHFGTYHSPVAVLLETLVPEIRNKLPKAKLLLIGAGSHEFRERLVQRRPELGRFVESTGSLPHEEISCHISACDLLMQPYPDGVSTRRTSLMAGLAHAKPIVTTSGHLTEAFWAATAAVELVPAGDTDAFVNTLTELCGDQARSNRMGRYALRLYQTRFDLAHTLESLCRGSDAANLLCVSS